MKQRISKRSLIFPIICAAVVNFAFIASLSLNSISDRIFAAACAVTSLLPVLSVCLLKTDISRLIKWQALFTAATAAIIVVSLILVSGARIYGDRDLYIFAVPVFVPLALNVAAGVVYGVKLRNEDKRVQKWFTAFLSLPTVYITALFVYVFLDLMINGLNFPDLG
ncbi:MAG: hypothetical protein IJ784_03050 [Ruminiclostridium sp.]|nr:hypothetical protein [Ruminiclostridium sp.]